MNDTTTTHGGAGRGQGRKPLSDSGSKSYKMLLTDEQRVKLDALGGAAWLRGQIDFETRLGEIDMSKAVNLSARYVSAMWQMPQFSGAADRRGPLTHIMTGVRVLPLGDLTDEADDSGLLEVVYPGGVKAEVVGHYFFQMALKEAAEIEVNVMPEDFCVKKKSYTQVQSRIADLGVHLRGKHGLD